MSQSAPKKNFFTCKSCGREQNLDQSIHIKQKYCVSCFNKEQIHREMMKQLQDYINYLKESKQYSRPRKKKMDDILQLNEMLLPKTLMKMNDDELNTAINELQQIAFKIGIEALKEKYHFDVMNTMEINADLITKIAPLWRYKSPPTAMLEEKLLLLDPVLDIKGIGKDKFRAFFKDLKKYSVVPYFTYTKGEYITKADSPFKFRTETLVPIIKTYRIRIKRANSQPFQFRRFIELVGGLSAGFQTMDDRLEKAIGEFVNTYATEELIEYYDRFISEVNRTEDAPLIPNIAKYILENYERLFYTWFTSILFFEKSRFMVSDVKTGSRTDFIMRVQYRYSRSELKCIEEGLGNTAETLIRSKGEQRIKKIQADKQIPPEQKPDRIAKAQEQLTKDLLPENVQKKKEEQAKTAPMTARVLLLNSEKAFNIILNKIIRFHYKRLKITTPVQYITNVLASDAHEKKAELEAWYLIHSREW